MPRRWVCQAAWSSSVKPRAQALSMCLNVRCSAKALSKYTEMVDNLIRQQKDKLEAASDEARLRLREWDMPEALQVPSLTALSCVVSVN